MATRDPNSINKTELEILLVETPEKWTAWLEENHTDSRGVWLRLAKKASDLKSVSYAEALEVALCFGWIDGQKKSYDEDSWLQKFTPRGRKSIWSKINREKVLLLIETDQMRPAGLAEIERAQQDGRWEAAYDGASTIQVPEDFLARLEENTAAKEFFAGLNKTNRYAILFRLQTAKKVETRAKRMEQCIAMLEKGEKFHP